MKTYHKPLSHRLPGIAAVVMACGLLWQGCSSKEEAEAAQPQASSLQVELVLDAGQTKALGDATHSVNRILLLPFRKINEGGSDTPSNFAPVYGSAKQLDVNSFTVYTTIPSLTAGATYRMLVLGYARTDYNYNSSTPTAASGNFSIGAETTPVTLANFRLKPVSPVVVPEFFTGVCTAYGPGGVTVIGASFQPQSVAVLRGTLQRIVSGLSITVTGVPGYVKSMTLSADQLVTSSVATTGVPVTWQTTGDAGVKTLGTATPSGGTVTFEKLILPTQEDRKTRLKLQVSYGSTSETYTVRVADKSGVSDSNYFIFQPNRVTKVTGTYAKINLGFQFAGTVGLDDDSWDGYH